MRLEVDYLLDILSAIDRIERWVAGSDFNKFASDEQLRSAVAFELLVIGEASNHISKNDTERIP